MKDCDLLIIGGGPAGLSAAINGASEGLSVCLLDAGSQLGGQARESNAIENYPGFPRGITGQRMMANFVHQARRFSTTMLCPLRAARLDYDHKTGKKVITTDDYQSFTAKAVLLSMGLSYRRLDVPGIGALMGRGVHYGLPNGAVSQGEDCSAVIVGGANSAGQAALHLARNPRTTVYMVIRKTITAQMSSYLVERISSTKNIRVLENQEIKRLRWSTRGLQGIETNGGTIGCSHLFIFIGAIPKTLWLEGCVELDEKKFVYTGQDLPVRSEARQPLPFETCVQGVFAAGDIRHGSVKRIATAIGEGATALQMTHQYLNH